MPMPGGSGVDGASGGVSSSKSRYHGPLSTSDEFAASQVY